VRIDNVLQKSGLKKTPVATSTDRGTTVAVASADHGIHVFDAKTAKETRTFEANGDVRSLELSGDGRALVSTGMTWNSGTWRTGPVSSLWATHTPSARFPRMEGRPRFDDGDLVVVDIGTWRPTLATAAGSGSGGGAVSADGKRIANMGKKGVRVTDLLPSPRVRTLPTSKDNVQWCRFLNLSPDGTWIAIDTERTLTVLDAETGKELQSARVPEPRAAVFSNDGHFVAVAQPEEITSLDVVRGDTHEIAGPLPGQYSSYASALAVMSGGATIAASLGKSGARVWDLLSRSSNDGFLTDSGRGQVAFFPW
jgi:WD40 repeat protein